MGKKGSWFSAIKRAFTPNSKEKLVNGSEKRNAKEKKKWEVGKPRYGETTSFIPLYREPSSIEKILGDAERDQQKTHLVSSVHGIRTPSMPSRVVHHRKEANYNPPTPKNHHIAAIKIQAAYRGYMARRSFRALKGLVRLQRVMRGHSVRHQTMNAMKCTQLLVKVQSQIQSRRIQMLENQTLQSQNSHKNDKELESSLRRWILTQPSETGQEEEWDYSLLTKEEIDARMQRKVEAVIKRERALAYAYSQQLWKATPKSAQTALMEIQSGGFPWWWSFLERQLPGHPSESEVIQAKKDYLTPPKPILEPDMQPQSSNYKQTRSAFDNRDTLTPRSSKSVVATMTKTKPIPLTPRTPQTNSSTPVKHAKPRTKFTDFSFDVPLRDDESLTSCPPFSVPNYMAPTISAKAKARTPSPRERLASTPTTTYEQKRRFSFPLTQSIGSIKWNKGSFFTKKDSSSQRIQGKHKSTHSIGNLSIDSTISLPAGVGRKPFK